MEQIIFEKMRAGTQVRITQELRKDWHQCRGQWFSIIDYSADDTVTLMDKYYTQLTGIPISELII